MIAVVVVAALALGQAGETLPFGGKLPYPPPRLVRVTESTKCDMGTISSVDPTHGTMKGTTPAGLVTYKVSQDVQVFAKDGKPAGGIASLSANQKYRAYYVIDDGARVLEIDLE